jgi:hypothetical protein
MSTEDRERKEINTQLLGMSREELPRVSIAGSEIVRRQYLSHIRDVVVTIRPDGIQFNQSCIAKMEGVVHILIMIHRGQRRLIVRACDENDRDGQRWCALKDGARKSRMITGGDFATRAYRMMGWSKGYYAKICGTPALQMDNEDELLMVFELDEAEMYPMTARSRQAAGVEDEEISADTLKDLAEAEARREQEKAERRAAADRGEKPKKGKRKSRFPDAWTADSFGTPVEQYVGRPVIEHLKREDAEQLMIFTPEGHAPKDGQ